MEPLPESAGPEPVHAPHDHFFQEIFGRVETARDFFQTYLPARLVAVADWATLEREPSRFVDERLQGVTSDLLFSVRLQGRPGLLYCLFEHQSTVDPDMPFRLLVYMVRIWEWWRKERRPGTKAPPIVPLVLYHGKGKWTVSRHFQDWLDLPVECRAELEPFQPRFEFALVDLSRVPLEAIRGELLVRLALTLMKAEQEDRLEEWLERSAPVLRELLEQQDRMALFRTLLVYALHAETNPASTIERWLGKIQDETIKTDVMSIAEQLMQKGWQKGQQEGWQKGRLVGQIQMCQKLLHRPVSADQELERKEMTELEAELRRLEAEMS